MLASRAVAGFVVRLKPGLILLGSLLVGVELACAGAYGSDNQTPSSDAATSDGGASNEGGTDARTITCAEAGAKLWNGHCYFVIAPQPQAKAKSQCGAAGAHLVTVTQTEEDTLIRAFSGGRDEYWIGLESTAPSRERSDYRWITGEATGLAFWASSQPDEQATCVALSEEAGWQDRPCDSLYEAVCEQIGRASCRESAETTQGAGARD